MLKTVLVHTRKSLRGENFMLDLGSAPNNSRFHLGDGPVSVCSGSDGLRGLNCSAAYVEMAPAAGRANCRPQLSPILHMWRRSPDRRVPPSGTGPSAKARGGLETPPHDRRAHATVSAEKQKEHAFVCLYSGRPRTGLIQLLHTRDSHEDEYSRWGLRKRPV